MGTPHKHAALIKAWADGAEIQWRESFLDDGEWRATLFPSWEPDLEYRIKPEPKPDIVRYAKASFCRDSVGSYTRSNTSTWWSMEKAWDDNIKATFDGETGKLKKVEIV